MITLILLLVLVARRIRHGFKFQRAAAGRCRAPIAEEVVDLWMADAFGLLLLVLLRSRVISLVPMHLGVLGPRYAALLF